jgi:hypothetical protein
MIGSDTYNPNQLLTGTCQTAQALFHTAFINAQMAKIWAFITGRPNTLVDGAALIKGKKVGSRRNIGIREVQIRQIQGSEGRCEDFDRSFRPRNYHNQGRWMRLAIAFTQGVPLPAVDLIQVGNSYIVRDGHHRISVMKALGGACIDANVTVWDLKDE